MNKLGFIFPQTGANQPQTVINFENENDAFAQKSNSSSEVRKDVEMEIESSFSNIIGQCFLPYLYVYINSVDR